MRMTKFGAEERFHHLGWVKYGCRVGENLNFENLFLNGKTDGGGAGAIHVGEVGERLIMFEVVRTIRLRMRCRFPILRSIAGMKNKRQGWSRSTLSCPWRSPVISWASADGFRRSLVHSRDFWHVMVWSVGSRDYGFS